MSKLENHIVNILFNEKIKYEREKSFPDLKAGKFRFDFYLPDFNIIIEVNGNQHYKDIYNNRQKFLQGQEYDRRKISWALSKNITMYIIPEWEVYNINSFNDILQDKYIPKNRWHNDYIAEVLKK